MTNCFGLRISKKLISLILIVAVVAATGLGATSILLSTYSYAREVPVQLGYSEPENYWILSSIISEQEAFKMVLHTGDSETVDSQSEAEAQSEVGLLFDPLKPVSETNLEVENWEFKDNYLSYNKAPAYDINDAGWLTSARYSVRVFKNGGQLSGQEIAINYKEPKVVKLPTPDGEVTINNLGILPQGVEVPSGDLVVVLDPNQQYHIWSKSELLALLSWWNDGAWLFAPAPINPFIPLDWNILWDYATDQGRLPSDTDLTYVSDIRIVGDNDYIQLVYSDIVFAGDITVYIPSELADTLIVNLFEPKPEITGIDPSPLPTVYEGEDFTLSVTIKNVGTEGTISVSLTSNRYASNPITETSFTFKEGESLTFSWQVYALNVESDTTAELKVFAQGRGETAEQILTGTILDKPGYTPPDPPDPPPVVPPTPTPSYPWELLIVVAIGIVAVWYFWRRKRKR